MKKLLVLLFIMILAGCTENSVHVETIEGSDESWYWIEDSTSDLDGNILYTPSINSNALIVYDLSTKEKELWEMDEGVLIHQASVVEDDLYLRISYEETGNSELVRAGLKDRSFEKICDVSSLVLFLENSAYYVDGSQLMEVDLKSKQKEIICDFRAVETDSDNLYVEMIAGHRLIIRHNVYTTDDAKVFVVNLDEKTWDYVQVNARDYYMTISSNTTLRGVDETGLYFWACTPDENIHFKTDFQGENMEQVSAYPNIYGMSPDSPVSENGVYYGQLSSHAGVMLNESKMLLMNWNEGNAKVISEMDSCSEMRCYSVDGFIKSVTYRSDGTKIIYLTHPQTGKQWEIHSEKLSYYKENEENALEGIEHPIEIISKTSSKTSTADQAGKRIVTEEDYVELNGKLYYVQDYSSLICLDLNTLQKTEILFPQMNDENFYLVASVETDSKDIFVHYDCFIHHARSNGLVQLDGNTYEVKMDLKGFLSASVSKGKLYLIQPENPDVIESIDLETGEHHFEATIDSNRNYYQIESDGNQLWAMSGSTSMDIYSTNEDDKMIKAISVNQFGTWSEDSLSIIPSKEGLLLQYWYIDDSPAIVNDIYKLQDGKAELFIGGILGETSIVLCENGAFYVIPDGMDASVPFQDWNDEDYDPYSLVYYIDQAGNRQRLCRLEGTDAELIYLDDQKQLLIKENDWREDKVSTYLLDLETLDLKKID